MSALAALMGHGDKFLGLSSADFTSRFQSKLCVRSIWQHIRNFACFIHFWPHNNHVKGGSKESVPF